MLGKLRGLSALQCLWLQFAGSRSWGSGGLASPGYSRTRPVQRNMKDAKTVSAPLGQVWLSLLALGSSSEGSVCVW